MSQMHEQLLIIENLSVCYASSGGNGSAPAALKGVSLSVSGGEVLAVIGPNGAGKTSLLRAASGVIRPAEGRVYVGGRDVTRLPPLERARRLAVVPQARSLPPAFTVFDTVLLGRTPYLGWLGRPATADLERAHWALAQVDAAHLAERRVGELSGGEQQRVLLARALAQQTPVLLLDEPTAHLDLQHQAAFLELARRQAHQHRLAVLLVLHEINLAALYADRVALLVGGRLQRVGSPAQVLTEAGLSDAFQTPVRVIAHPDYGLPLVMPGGAPWQEPAGW